MSSVNFLGFIFLVLLCIVSIFLCVGALRKRSELEQELSRVKLDLKKTREELFGVKSSQKHFLRLSRGNDLTNKKLIKEIKRVRQLDADTRTKLKTVERESARYEVMYLKQLNKVIELENLLKLQR